jgi:hypothetical protein
MTSAGDLAKMVPGFDFLQGLMKNVGNAIPGLPAMSQWVAPTLDPEELDKRIQELKTVQFWLEQNARLMSTTIQALEVQRMTLSTLKTMNLPLTDLRNALKIGVPTASNTTAAVAATAPTEVSATTKKGSAVKNKGVRKSSAPTPAVPPAVDPLQWWGALTQQFTELATRAVKDSAKDAAMNLAGAAVKQSINTAGKVLKTAASKAAGAAGAGAATAKTRRR